MSLYRCDCGHDFDSHDCVDGGCTPNLMYDLDDRPCDCECIRHELYDAELTIARGKTADLERRFADLHLHATNVENALIDGRPAVAVDAF